MIIHTQKKKLRGFNEPQIARMEKQHRCCNHFYEKALSDIFEIVKYRSVCLSPCALLRRNTAVSQI
uniref:Uncharacterized protein n=1 Tax=Anguilla anguilla TaxID=7936 RepID=A0A0E9TDP2_ANGAN